VLRFELIEVDESRFGFRLIRPALPIWGAFDLSALGPDRTEVSLTVGGKTAFGRRLLRFSPVRHAIKHQIGAEVAHIASSMEALFAS